jgi:molecular chaperone HscB
MTSQTSIPTLQVCRSCGGGAPVDVHFCPQCSKILSIGRHGDYFTFFELPRKLVIDPADLEQRFRNMSRQFHPDYFYNATPIERRASLERSSYLNDAYRTLRHPIDRVEYLLGLQGCGLRRSGEAAPRVPEGLLEDVFALNEELDEVRALRAGGAAADVWRARLERARQPVEARRQAHEEQLASWSGRWDALVDAGGTDAERREVLAALRERVLERQYIGKMLEGIEAELAA